jgi:hypothetical protein
MFNAIKILIGDSLKNILKALLSSFGILFLISFLVVYASLRDSIKNYIEANLFGKLNINELVIYPYSTGKNKLFAHAANLNRTIAPGSVNAIRSLPDVTEVFPVIKLDYEVRVRGEMMGQARRIHMPLCGIDRRFFRGKDPRWESFRSRTPVPIMAPKAFIDLLNNYFSVIDAPQMNEQTLRGLPLQIIVTTPAAGADKNNELSIDAEIHSFTDLFAFIGAVVPSDFILGFAAKHRLDTGKPRKGYNTVMIYAKVRDIKKLPETARRIKAMGLTVESQNDIAQKTGDMLKIFDQFSLLIIGAFMVLTVISIFNSYMNIVYNMSQKFSLKRILGVSKAEIVLTFMAESSVVGLLYGIIGFYSGQAALRYLAHKIAVWIPAFSGIVVQGAGREVLSMALLFSIVISAVSALVPALFAANINLFKAVRK